VTPDKRWRRWFLVWLAVSGIAFAILLVLVRGGLASAGDTPVAPLAAEATASMADDECLACHSDPNASMSLPNGEAISLYADPAVFQRSVHGDKLNCVDCHVRNQTVPHPSLNVVTARDFHRAEYELCKRCHFENYTRTLDSMHFDVVAAGNPYAPVCTDCHTAHSVMRLTDSHVQIAKTCSQCHGEIYDQYVKSVHGSALESEGNPDVPVCTTCHGVHNIQSATTAAFRLDSVDMCARCHANKQLMDKYDISSNVLKTYLDDFHGKTIGFYQQQSSEVWPETPVCFDCHGVHNITPVDDPNSPVLKENLLPTCRQCHPDASANFPSAWLSHYEPSLKRAPIVFSVREYYRFLIPVMIVGLIMHISLDLWRLARNR
jgi:hypothetical protein